MAHRTDKSRTEDLTTDERAHRHPTKSANYTEDAQGVRDDNVSADFDGDSEENLQKSRNKNQDSDE